MVKSTPIPLEEQGCCVNDIFIAMHIATDDDSGIEVPEILGVFTSEKIAKKCAAAAKKEGGFKGKQAKAHVYTVVAYAVGDKFDG